MATTLPSLTQTIDNAFMTTWYTIRAEAVDNILNATVVWAALNAAGCLKPQTGGSLITRSIGHGQQAAVDVERGDTLPQGETELETMAIWRWRYMASHCQRSTFDDQQNNGPDKIKDLVGLKLKAARDGIEQRMESSLFNAIDTTEAVKTMQGLNDLVPVIASRATGTYGGITRPTYSVSTNNVVSSPDGGNTWWGPKYLPGVLASIEDDLLTDMKMLYNSIHNNQVPPNLIIGTQTIFELYEEFALDISQIVKDESTRLADLGFEVLRFKGKPFIWSPNMTANHVLMLNTDFIDVVYDPNLWFDMTDWKPIPLEPQRIAHIMCALNVVSDQLRRHGRLQYA